MTEADIVQFNSGRWPAYIQPTHTRIGCKYFSNDQWRNFSNEDISKMNRFALEYWNENKAIIFAIMDKFKK